MRQIKTINKVSQLGLSIDKTVSNIVDRLVLGDGELALASIIWVPVQELGLVGQAVLKLSEGRKETSTVGADLTVFTAETEFHGVPVALGELIDDLVRGAQRGKTEELGEVGEVLVSEEGNVSHQFVDDIGFGGVEGSGVVADVLSGEEGAEGETVEEVASREETSDGADGEASAGHQEVVDVTELRNSSGAVSTTFDEKLHVFVADTGGVGGVEVDELVPDGSPGLVFLLGVLKIRDFRAVAELLTDFADVTTALLVDFVTETRVGIFGIVLELFTGGESLLLKEIKFTFVCGEGGDAVRTENLHVVLSLLQILNSTLGLAVRFV